MFVASIVKGDRLEEWNEANILQRAQDFDSLPMDVIWGFCTSLLTIKYVKQYLQSMRRKTDGNKSPHTDVGFEAWTMAVGKERYCRNS